MNVTDDKHLKHHGLAHLVLTALLFLLAVVVFGGWTEGPLTSALFLGAKAYKLIAGTAAGELASADTHATSLLHASTLFIINLVIYYIIAAALIFLFNICFPGRKKGVDH